MQSYTQKLLTSWFCLKAVWIKHRKLNDVLFSWFISRWGNRKSSTDLWDAKDLTAVNWIEAKSADDLKTTFRHHADRWTPFCHTLLERAFLEYIYTFLNHVQEKKQNPVICEQTQQHRDPLNTNSATDWGRANGGYGLRINFNGLFEKNFFSKEINCRQCW